MLNGCSLRLKVYCGSAALVIIIVILIVVQAVYLRAYCRQADSVGRLAPELPWATKMTEHVCALQVTMSQLKQLKANAGCTIVADTIDLPILRSRFNFDLETLEGTISECHKHFKREASSDRQIGDYRSELVALKEMQQAITEIKKHNTTKAWLLDEIKVDTIGEQLAILRGVSSRMSILWRARLENFASDMRSGYRAGLWVAGICAIAVLFFSGMILWTAHASVWIPLRTVVNGVKRVTDGDYKYRIDLKTRDETAVLADAFNKMTERLQVIRSDLDAQVKQRTFEAIRSEQLAGVGVLAAGVAHEINNPLQAIAFYAESLDERLGEWFSECEAFQRKVYTDLDIEEEKDNGPDSPQETTRRYLKVIQEEAFRSKEITQRLLDFARQGSSDKIRLHLNPLVQSVVDIICNLGSSKGKKVEMHAAGDVWCTGCENEIKQVVLNLTNNALEATEKGGQVNLSLDYQDDHARLVVADNGCGMPKAIMDKIFDPFFTQQLGGQGTGLGLSITHRIIDDHDGRIIPDSKGPGQGARFTILLPSAHHEHKENKSKKRRAA